MFSFEARSFLPIDLPLVLRLMQRGISLDSEQALTHGNLTSLGSTVLGVVTDLGAPTYVIKDGEVAYTAQFRHRYGDPHAHISFIAPGLDDPFAEEAWTVLLDAMVCGAGKRGAHTLNAEIDETSDAFVVLRRCGFAVYARQDLWRREPETTPDADADLLRPVTENDAFAVNALYTNIVPRMVLQADTPPDPSKGWVCEQGGRIAAYISVNEGKSGLYVQSFLHPELDHNAGAIHAALLARLPRAERLPVYVCVRRYQDWLRGPLMDIGFSPWASQAVMVKHTVARIEHPDLSIAPSPKGAVRIVPPIKMVG